MKEINDERIDTLFKAVLELKTVDECRRFFTDLCTISELKSMSQRMEVALMLKRQKHLYGHCRKNRCVNRNNQSRKQMYKLRLRRLQFSN